MMSKELWFDTRLSNEEMNFLRDACSEKNKKDWRHDLAGNISKSELIEDKSNWFYENVLKKHTERMFYDDWNNYRKYHIEKTTEEPQFKLKKFWVNYQKQHEFNPIHDHGGGIGFTFVIFVKIPTHWKEQHALPISMNSTLPSASDFQLLLLDEQGKRIEPISFLLSPEDEGRMLFFPAWVLHQVYPFYECEEDRVTISGNITLAGAEDPSAKSDFHVGEYEDKKNMLEKMENTVESMKEELKQIKKEREDKGESDSRDYGNYIKGGRIK